MAAVARACRLAPASYLVVSAPARNLHFIMHHGRPPIRAMFIFVGLLRSELDPAELAKHSDLFK